MTTRWAIKWQSRNNLDGYTSHIIWNGLCPFLFRTRREAREFIAYRYGFINEHPELKQEPFGWFMPKAVKVRVTVKEL